MQYRYSKHGVHLFDRESGVLVEKCSIYVCRSTSMRLLAV